MSRLDEIEAREQAATPAPWSWKGYASPEPDLCQRCDAIEATWVSGPNDESILTTGGIDEDPAILISRADYPLLRHAREDIPWLLAEVRRLQALADVDYRRYAEYILAAARMHPADCLTTVEDIERGLRINAQQRSDIEALKKSIHNPNT